LAPDAITRSRETRVRREPRAPEACLAVGLRSRYLIGFKASNYLNI